MAIRGSCLCGGVTFEIDRAVGPAEYCHCNRCRKVSGSNAILGIGVRTEDYRFLSGRELVKTYVMGSESVQAVPLDMARQVLKPGGNFVSSHPLEVGEIGSYQRSRGNCRTESKKNNK